ncbi:hypothetical protein [Candidatus Cyanaurora vandensis]|uniref:hypothetical protein n=1 Tax=Candidatus Cyanaurora vandensis TaxID=2714958 RepID=UPI0025804067|nr:hypothetical protein [Candidatus Cyanaurora vandensis]
MKAFPVPSLRHLRFLAYRVGLPTKCFLRCTQAELWDLLVAHLGAPARWVEFQ